jgi:plasmid stabilization system protein ParE
MKFAISVSDRAWSDADRVFEWIAARSPEGALRWNRVFEEALVQLQHDADQQALAPESVGLGREIRQRFFKTRRGRSYRLIYTIAGQEVRVLRVRGPGQAPVDFDDIGE